MIRIVHATLKFLLTTHRKSLTPTTVTTTFFIFRSCHQCKEKLLLLCLIPKRQAQLLNFPLHFSPLKRPRWGLKQIRTYCFVSLFTFEKAALRAAIDSNLLFRVSGFKWSHVEMEMRRQYHLSPEELLQISTITWNEQKKIACES